MCTGIEVIAAGSMLGSAIGGAVTLGEVLSIGGTLFSAVSAIGGGMAQNQAAKRNASIAEQNARMSTDKAAFDEERQQDHGRGARRRRAQRRRHRR
jgi:uncharacterized protein YcfJ